jgi:16S rRNA (uracil1498-N3)-methyltransferase
VVTSAPVFLVDVLPPTGSFLLDGPEGRHAATVRRMRVGEALELTDGRGRHAPALVVAVGRADLTLDVGQVVVEPSAAPRVVLVQALPKGDRGELAVELATEAGVDAVVPWQASRCVARWPDAAKADKGRLRWQAAAREAAKQSRRYVVPEVLPAASTAGVAALVGQAALALVLHESATASLASTALPATGDLVLIVGPEGGIAGDELAAFEAVGAIAVRLGPQVLRTSTAAAVALGAIGVLTGRWV